MDAKQLAEIKAREQAATPGSWQADYNTPFSNNFVGIYEETEGYIIKAEDEDEGYSTRQADADFIAHSRADIPALVAEVERLTKENTSQVEYINELADSIDNWRKLVNEKNGKLVQRSKRIATLKKALEIAYAEANNAIYFSDRSDYLPGLYDVCKAIKPEIEHEEIGKEYIQQAQELEGHYA